MKYINIILTVAIIALIIILIKIIYAPISFNKIKEERYNVVVKKLEKVRAVQFAYKDLKGHFANDFDDLINCIKNDTFRIIKVTGNPDDTTQIVTRDTSYMSVRDSLFSEDNDIESLRLIPYSKNIAFTMNADVIEIRKVKVSVFRVIASNAAILYGQSPEYYDKSKAIILGSMDEANYSISKPK